VPEASVVLLLLIEGPVAVFQQTPRAVTGAPPSLVTFPPLPAVVVVIEVIAVVVIVGAEAATVEKLISLPYTVSVPSVKYALI
jgi:hypothetical protein